MSEIWIVVANQSRANIYKAKPNSRKLDLVSQLSNSLGRERNSALTRKKPGIGMQSVGRAGTIRYVESKKHEPHEVAATDFAKTIVRFLNSQRRRSPDLKITLIAEARFLGKIRSSMTRVLDRCVVSTIRKDLLFLPVTELADRLDTDENKLSYI